MWCNDRGKKVCTQCYFIPNCRKKDAKVPFDQDLCTLPEYESNFRNNGRMHIKNCTNFPFLSIETLIFDILIECLGSQQLRKVHSLFGFSEIFIVLKNKMY